MTKKEKDQLLRAIEKLDDAWGFSCNAINMVASNRCLSRSYQQFYGNLQRETGFGSWIRPALRHLGYETDQIDDNDLEGQRILMILLFREVGLKGIGE